jgi:hypothetical protein
MAEKWIQKALSKKGSKGKLHRKLGIPEEKKIPASRLKAAEKKGGKIGKEAHLAETLKKLHHKHK